MDFLPIGSTKLHGEGRYDAFPTVAASGDKVVTLWRSAKALGHVADVGARIKGKVSTDGGKTYGATFTVAWDDADPLAELSPAGLAWDASRKMWVCLVLVKKFADTTYTSPSYSALLMWSLDGSAWTKLRDVPLPGVAWAFVSGLAVDAGRWIVTAYGRFPTGSNWVPLTMSSADAGVSWSPLKAPSGLPGGVNYAEPQIVRLASGSWLMMIRCDTSWSFHQARSKDGVTWVADGSPLGGASGQPSMGVTGDGSVVLLVRAKPTIAGDNAHGPWRWASSSDEGMTWTLRDDFPESASGRYMMYGGLARTADGSLACVFASEDDPAQVWQSASVRSTRFVFTPLKASLKSHNGVPYVEILGGGQQPIVRVSTDKRGREMRDVVRVRVLGGAGGALDYEAQQGHTYKYEVGGRSTRPLRAPVLAESWLINPARPERSIMARVVTDGDGEHPITSTLTDVPLVGGAGLQYPHVTYSGRLGARQGSTVIRTHTELDEDDLLECIGGLQPLFWSQHPGLRLPEWLAVTSLKVARFAQICPCGCGHDLLDNPGQWRDWTIGWVQQPRPTIEELPHRRTIGEIDMPIGDINVPIGKL